MVAPVDKSFDSILQAPLPELKACRHIGKKVLSAQAVVADSQMSERSSAGP